jgi:hypothetical protein
MPRSRRAAHTTGRGTERNRHGRGLRSAVTGPHLPMLHTRIDFFDMTVASTAEYLRSVWPNELADASFEIGALPYGANGRPGTTDDKVERWRIMGDRIILYRVPVERLAHLHRNDESHRRMLIESCVFRAVAEYLGKDPWDLAPEGFRHF